MKKDKGVAIQNPKEEEEDDDDEEEEDGFDRRFQNAQSAALPFSTRNASSKYDFVKVKVWLGDNADHYYVLSRFLLSRMLTVTKIPNHVAIKIALELKKLLIDNSLLDVSQSDLEANLFKVCSFAIFSFQHLYYLLFTLLSLNDFAVLIGAFRLGPKSSSGPLVVFFGFHNFSLILVAHGAARLWPRVYKPIQNDDEISSSKSATGHSCMWNCMCWKIDYCYSTCTKAKFAKCVAGEILFITKTSMVYELLRTATDAPLTSSPVWARDFSSSDELITEFCRECRIVRKGLAGDLKKAMKDGKPIIIEGIHLDPSIYLMNDENKSSTTNQGKEGEKDEGKIKNGSSAENHSTAASVNQDNDNSGTQIARSDEVALSVDMVSGALENVNISSSGPECQGILAKDAEPIRPPAVNKEKSGPEPIIIPIILKMAEFDHKALLEEWLSTRAMEKFPVQDKDKLIANLKTIQDYLCSFKSQGYSVVNISATAFPQTLDWLHSYLLQCIEQGTTSVSAKSDGQTVGN
ncbi:hypothetical protein SASPL_115330 [Salvia splendens]|uniref:Uncharacterized protein n=1 Tax=Salvia splendens TaxID=180675 RepID=A0A8X9A071_SALSN|nr:hypothetical protein SASPL_115330 [Salvia splendens]